MRFRTIGDVHPDQPEYRLSDAERAEAIEALGEHMSTGRLDIDEYGERTAQATAAKTRADLEAVFRDLPEPRPAVLRMPEPSPGMRLEPIGERSLVDRMGALAVPAVAIVTLVLFFTVARGFFPILVVPAICAVAMGLMMRRGR